MVDRTERKNFPSLYIVWSIQLLQHHSRTHTEAIGATTPESRNGSWPIVYSTLLYPLPSSVCYSVSVSLST